MKLLRFGNAGEENLDELTKVENKRFISVIDDINGNTIAPESLDKLKNLDTSSLPEVNGNPRIGPCVNNVGKFLCIGLNFSDHAAETMQKLQKNQFYFQKRLLR